jgi:SAM-dependent methyltransferase
VVDAAERAGVRVRADARVLDFGCSSGRVLRVLAAWRQDVEWIGCDPNTAAAEWAGSKIPHATAFASPQEPPLPLEEASLDLVYAVSVWSHFGRTQAIRWLEEMHRVIKPGGSLVVTTQGLPSLAHYLKHGNVSEAYARERAREVLIDGHSYFPAFDEGGDWGVKHPEWGMAFLSADWLAATALPAWSLQLFQPARVDQNQDLGVLIRR